jgi:thiamine pyrophosphokinase
MMKLPSELKDKKEWVFLGPMGPEIPEGLSIHPLICVDGGAHFSKNADIWVGDKDSFKGEIISKHVFQFSVHKDKSDLCLAFELFADFSPKTLHLWGFLGGRKDHEIFNLGEALKFLDNNPESQILFYDLNGKMVFHLISEGVWRFSHKGLFSVGCLRAVDITLTGKCDYPIHKRSPISPFSSNGLSNVADGEIELDTSGPLFIYFPEDP